MKHTDIALTPPMGWNSWDSYGASVTEAAVSYTHLDVYKRQYLDYLDFQVLCLLFCLMAVIQGFDSLLMFQRLAGWLLARIHSLRGLYLVLVFLPFFCSMFLTNDVALLTFVPLSLIHI